MRYFQEFCKSNVKYYDKDLDQLKREISLEATRRYKEKAHKFIKD